MDPGVPTSPPAPPASHPAIVEETVRPAAGDRGGVVRYMGVDRAPAAGHIGGGVVAEQERDKGLFDKQEMGGVDGHGTGGGLGRTRQHMC